MSPEANSITIPDRLKRLSQEDPEKPAFIFWDKNLKKTVLNRRDVWDKSRKCAAFFLRQGVVKGDVLCDTLINSQERLITIYGAILAGAISMNGQKFLADGEDIIKNMADARCKFVLIDPEEEKGFDFILDKIKKIDDKTGKYRYQGLPNLNKVIPIARESWLQNLEQEQEMYVDESITDDDVAMVMTTSGSTGFAKVVPHTHARLGAAGGCIKEINRLDQDSVFYNEDSLGWIGGAPIIYPYTGYTRVLVDWSRGMVENYSAFAHYILEHESCDSALITPFEIEGILNHMDSINQHKLENKLPRVIITGGGPVSNNMMNAMGRISETLTVMYGATEIGIIFGNNLTKPSDYENGCCGYPGQFVEAKVVDKDLQEVTTGESGEILLRGPSLFQGYMNNPEANEKALLADGWWRTTDIGYTNEKGQLFVYCRKSNVINYKGYMCYPGWMEARIDRHPDIKKSFVVGIPHPVVHHEICLCISKTSGSNLTAEDAREYCKSLFLTSVDDAITPIPKYVLFFGSFPQKNNGKVDRNALIELAGKRVAVENGKLCDEL